MLNQIIICVFWADQGILFTSRQSLLVLLSEHQYDFQRRRMLTFFLILLEETRPKQIKCFAFSKPHRIFIKKVNFLNSILIYSFLMIWIYTFVCVSYTSLLLCKFRNRWSCRQTIFHNLTLSGFTPIQNMKKEIKHSHVMSKYLAKSNPQWG